LPCRDCTCAGCGITLSISPARAILLPGNAISRITVTAKTAFHLSPALSFLILGFSSCEGYSMAAAPHPLVLRSRDVLARGDIKAAEEAAEERLKTAGRDINALELRSLIQQRRGQFGQAARTLDTVIGIDRRADWAFN